jgi:hypothetical protein
MLDLDLEEGDSYEVANRNLGKLRKIESVDFSSADQAQLIKLIHHWLEVREDASAGRGSAAPPYQQSKFAPSPPAMDTLL